MKWFKPKKYRIIVGCKEGTFIVQYRANILMPWVGIGRDLKTWLNQDAQEEFCIVKTRDQIVERVALHKRFKSSRAVEYLE